MIAPEELTLSAAGLSIAARAWGATAGAPVLALHGWLDNAASFEALAPLLPELRLVAIDLPGHGLSQHKPAGSFYHFVDWVPDVLAVADALGWQRFALLGHSMGAGIASLVPAVAPERVSRVVLLEGLGPLSGAAAEVPERLRTALAERRRLAQKTLRPYPSRDEAVRVLQKGVGRISLAAARRLVERGTVEVPGGVVWRADPRLRGTSALRFTEEQALAFLRELRCPALLVRAEQGYPFDEPVFAQRIAAVPGLRLERVPGDHHVHLDAPERVARLIASFLSGAPADV
jgi:pimeloyl-ACP methyl ester carboxylesterase